MRSLCPLPVAKNHNFGQIFDIFGGSCTDPLLPMRAKFGVQEQTQGPHLHTKFHLNVFTVSASGGQKPKFWHFGHSCTDPITDRGQIWCAGADPCCMLTCQISPRSVCLAKKTQILPFFELRYLWCRQLAAIAESWTRCTATPWAIKKRSQLIFVCNFVKNQRILMQFSLLESTMNGICDGMNFNHSPN